MALPQDGVHGFCSIDSVQNGHMRSVKMWNRNVKSERPNIWLNDNTEAFEAGGDSEVALQR